jgi:hypothetical protein
MSAPDVVVELARTKGYDFDAEELTSTLEAGIAASASELSEGQLAQTVGGAGIAINPEFINPRPEIGLGFDLPRNFGLVNPVPTISLNNNIWRVLRRPGGGIAEDGPSFKLTIPGPSFVQVQSTEKRQAAEIESADAPTPSASAIYEELLRD